MTKRPPVDLSPEPTHYINVDLDVYSRVRLDSFVQALGVFIDTILICSATGIMILLSGTLEPGSGNTGTVLTQQAMTVHIGAAGNAFIAVAILFFAFTTVVAYYYMAETNLEYIAHNKAPAWSLNLLKFLIMASVAFGAVWSSEGVWALGSVGVGIMAWLNIIAIIILQKPALLALRDYEAQKKAGLDPTFDPDKLGISNAEIWKGIGKADRSAAPIGSVQPETR